MSQNLSSAAVMIGTLRAYRFFYDMLFWDGQLYILRVTGYNFQTNEFVTLKNMADWEQGQFFLCIYVQ